MIGFIPVFVSSQRSLAVTSVDLTMVSLFDGRRSEGLNTWGGAWGIGNTKSVYMQTEKAHFGPGSLAIDLGPTKATESRYFQCFASGFGPTPQYRQTRDLTRQKTISFYLYNAMPVSVRGQLALKDYRDSLSHRAVYGFDLPQTTNWTHITVPLDFGAPGWTVEGAPDVSRLHAIDFIMQPSADLTDGRLYLDNVSLTEVGEPVDVDSSPLRVLVERIARRQWHGLWAARSRDHGLIPNNSYQVTDAGLNATATVLWMLPEATRRGWVSQVDADQYIGSLLGALNQLLDHAAHLPPRNVDWVTRQPSLLPEESSVDAAFLALGLHRYKSLPTTTPALRETIDATRNRFDFSAFSSPMGWQMAYRYASPQGPAGFTADTYNGYTNETNLISLAAHLSERHHVPIETHWNQTAHRISAGLSPMAQTPVVHSLSEFRAPFTQALWNLFVDVRERGVDSYPDGRLAVNPWNNFVCYEQHVTTRLTSMGRRYLFQPDAGDDGTMNCYQQFSMYNDFGQPDLFMPWSVSLSLLAGAKDADDGFRFLLRHRLDGPFGLADSALWTTGATEPRSITARHDFWNTGLSTMALLEWLADADRPSRSFAELPEVRAALDRVFPITSETKEP